MIRMYAGQFDELGKALAGHGDKKPANRSKPLSLKRASL
jgi:hypothetical protein